MELGIRLLSAHPGVTPEVQSLAIDYGSKRDPVRIWPIISFRDQRE